MWAMEGILADSCLKLLIKSVDGRGRLYSHENSPILPSRLACGFENSRSCMKSPVLALVVLFATVFSRGPDNFRVE